jgi:eukaryotic-like serine/threonine-protein kinase
MAPPSSALKRAPPARTSKDPHSGAGRVRPDPLAGLVVRKRYRLEEAIGDRGHGVVYRARHTETGGLLAVRLLRADARLKKSAARRFFFEARNAAALSHPNAIRVTDFGVEGKMLFYVMEHLEGRSLARLLSDGERLPWPRVRSIVVQTLAALCAAHEHPRRILHRALTPGAILVLNPPGHSDFVKVVDFGVAKALLDALGSPHGVAGNPLYMAPEQWEGGHASTRSDLYALGCLLYESLAGVPPFQSASKSQSYAEDLRWMHQNVVPAPLRSQAAADVPEGALLLAQRLMSKRPARRPRSAREALALLLRARREESEVRAQGSLPREAA